MHALLSAALLLSLGASAPAPLSHTAARLRALTPIEFAAGEIPSSWKGPLAAYRTQLAALVREVAAAAPAEVDAPGLKKRLLDALAAQGLAPVEGDTAPGALLEVRVLSPEGHGELRAVTLRWAVPQCGEDSLLTLLRLERRAWRPVLEERSGKLERISDGLADLSLVVSPPDPQGESLALTADFTPWCTSSWSTGRYRIYRLPAKGRAARLLRARTSLWMSDEAFTLTAGPGFVQLESFTSQQLDPDLHHRVKLVRYSLEGGELRRVAPLADTAAGFLAEWQRLPWAEAKRWSAPGLATLHRQMAKSLAGTDCLGKFTERKASVDGKRWRLGLAFEAGERPCALPKRSSFDVSLKDGAYFLDSAPAEPPAGEGWQPDEP